MRVSKHSDSNACSEINRLSQFICKFSEQIVAVIVLLSALAMLEGPQANRHCICLTCLGLLINYSVLILEMSCIQVNLTAISSNIVK